MHVEDEATFKRQVNANPTPDVEADLANLQQMLNRSHLSGPVGPLGVAIVAMLNGFKPPAVAKAIGEIDWRKVPKGTQVVYSRGEDRRQGTFQAIAAHGQVVLSYDGDKMPREVPPKYVSLVDETPEPSKNGKKKEPVKS